jgi:glycosyltransferase involved in cell wall biosynthesis
LFWKSRIRQRAASAAVRAGIRIDAIDVAALQRIGPELRAAAMRVLADLYIAHNLGALPAAVAAAAKHGALAGFDAEDFHSGQLTGGEQDDLVKLTRRVEQRLIPRCAYVTAASPQIADAYAALCNIPKPTVVLNVFPLASRPAKSLRRADTKLTLYWFSQTIGPGRGLEQAVRALKLLPAEVELHLRGAWQTGYESDLRAIASGEGVAQHRIVGHLPAPPDQMIRLAAIHDVGLALEPGHPANNNFALSNKLFTYLLAGCAGVATHTAAQAQLCSQLGSAAVVCDPENPAALASAIRPWLDNRALLHEARIAAWNLGTTKFNWESEQHRFLSALAGAVHERRQEGVKPEQYVQEHLSATTGAGSL